MSYSMFMQPRYRPQHNRTSRLSLKQPIKSLPKRENRPFLNVNLHGLPTLGVCLLIVLMYSIVENSACPWIVNCPMDRKGSAKPSGQARIWMRRKSTFNTIKSLNGERKESKHHHYHQWTTNHLSPAPSAHLLRFYQLELHASACPGNEVGIGWIIEKGNQELPQLKGTSPLVGGPLPVHGGLLFDFACLG